MAAVQRPESLMGACVMSAAEQGLQRPGLSLSITSPTASGQHIISLNPNQLPLCHPRLCLMKYMIVSIGHELFVFTQIGLLSHIFSYFQFIYCFMLSVKAILKRHGKILLN